MTTPVFPTLVKEQDSKYYGIEHEDVAMKSTIEGGYVVSRAKHTRAPRKTFTTGYTEIGNADRAALQAFYDSVKGGSVVFHWIDPVDGVTYSVRFADKLNFKYTGIGVRQVWDVQFSLEQA